MATRTRSLRKRQNAAHRTKKIALREARAAAPTRVSKPREDLRSVRDLGTDAWQYQLDFWQRSVLFLDTLRERANNMLDHEAAGMPPVLAFEYETVLDARAFERPANYALLRIIPPAGLSAREFKRPVIIIDPRAGHGPGIGGSKPDSEVGIALQVGHPVYFVSFFPEPCAGQTLADVHRALRRFVEEVATRHPDKTAPVLYGNCQAGWLVALLAADCAGMAGPAVLNGSPLSYWAGEPGVNTMRLEGAMLGGVWLNHFMGDLGNGTFDGAWLVQNFERINPGAVWDKYATLFANLDDEHDRFLDFERWWNGFFSFSREEIVETVDKLFVGNKLERGELELSDDCLVDLRRVRNPLVIFASHGDTITPPHQALNWIAEVWSSTKALKTAGQRIVYLLHPDTGHLGIFVSAQVARLQHRAILEHVDEIEALKPGLYEMKILNPTGDPDPRARQYSVAFEERRVEDIRFDYPREAFESAGKVSDWNEAVYRSFVSPWVQAASTPWSSALLKWLHPMRTSRYLFSERLNPWMAAAAPLAALVRAQRRPAGVDNANVVLERQMLRATSERLDALRKLRDAAIPEARFKKLYE